MTSLSQWSIVLVMVVSAVTGNLLLKLGAVRIDSIRVAEIATNWLLWAGLGALALCAAAYILLLRLVPLHLAQTFMALQFAVTVAAAWAVLGESISAMRLFGLVIIFVGVLIVSQTQ